MSRPASGVSVLPDAYTRQDMHRDFKAVFGTEQGERVLAHIMEWASPVLATQALQGMTASEKALVLEGQRELGRRIVHTTKRIYVPADEAGKRPDVELEKVGYGGRKR